MTRDYVLQPFQPVVNLHIDYARELNAQQLAAVTAPPGPALVIAGAGSGKTRTLTYRVAYLLEQGVPPERILLLTFTNKAASEMMRRVAELLGQELAALWGGTFHAIGNRVLRRHATLLGCQPDFIILDREDSEDLIAACRAETDIDLKATRFPKAEVLGEIFSLALNTRRSVAQILNEQYEYFAQFAPQIADLHERYTARKRATNSMDFDDLLAQWLRLMQEHAEVCELYQRRFQFVLVDEYQDTNQLQSDLIDLLAARHHNVMVVGDDAQSIYGWRGANFHNILEFPKRHPETRIYKIETNYRSRPEILNTANAAIAANANQFAKQLVPARKPGLKPALIVCGDASQQAAFVAQRVLELREEGVDLSKTAVLYRSHFHALELQLELTRRNIPFSITSGIRFFEQAHIKDATAYLRLVTNPRDELAFKRLALMLPGVGPRGADKLWRKFVQQVQGPKSEVQSPESAKTKPMPNVAQVSKPAVSPTSKSAAPANPRTTAGLEARDTADLSVSASLRRDRAEAGGEGGEVCATSRISVSAALRSIAFAVPAKAAAAWTQFADTLAQLEEESARASAAKMIQLVVEAGYEDYLKENYANYRGRLDDLEQLAVFASQFASVEEFLTQLALLTNVEAETDRPDASDNERLRLTTVHQAKGLEFDVVFVIMLCDGLFPSARSLRPREGEDEDRAGEEEERRLFYVAITRARDELYLSYPLMRAGRGAGGDLMQQPSRFLTEIPRALVNSWNLRPYA